MTMLPVRLMAKNRGITIRGSYRTKRLRKKLSKHIDELIIMFWNEIRNKKIAEGWEPQNNNKVLGKYWKHRKQKMNCPKCNAESVSFNSGGERFACGSAVEDHGAHMSNFQFVQSTECRDNEICVCGHRAGDHAANNQGRVNLFCERSNCDCNNFERREVT